jgi:hypothetical protein
MADDQLFDKAGAKDDAPATDKAPAKDDAPAGLTQADIDKSIGTLKEEIGGSLQGLKQSLDALKPKDPDPEPETLTDKQQALLQDPDQYIQSVAAKNRDPALDSERQVLLKQSQTVIVRNQKDAFEKKFGEGVWEAEIEKDLSAVLESMTPAMRASEAHVAAAVNGDSLMEKRTELSKKPEAPNMMTGTGRPRPGGPSLTPEEKDSLERWGDKGQDYPGGAKQYLIDREAGDTEDDFPEALEEK